MDNELARFDDLAVRHNAALAAFTSIYEAKHPPPVMVAVERDSLFIPIALVVMIVASVWVSGSRTVIEFGGGIVGLFAFIMIEGAIVTYAFFNTRRNFNEKRLKDVTRRAGVGLVLALVIGIIANIHHVLKTDGEQAASWINTSILISIGFSAPVLAYISGDVLAVESVANAAKLKRARAQHEKIVLKYQREKNKAWNNEKARWGVKIEVERAPVKLLHNPISNGNSNGKAGIGYTKNANAADIVLAHFEQHPEDKVANPVELAARLGVGKSTVYNVRKTLNGHSANGNGQHT